MNSDGVASNALKPEWGPLTRMQRRVAGVLVEKAKTVPDAYPMTLNAIVNASNQKSNRSPQMNLQDHQVDTVLEELRAKGAAIEVQGGGRVPKYKHCLYEWLGVDKTEIAVMAELLLRGPQTMGELRGRAARMEAIPDMAHLQPIVSRLMERGLVLSLTPPGRGQTVTHGLYLPEELEQLEREYPGFRSGQESTPSREAAPSPSPAFEEPSPREPEISSVQAATSQDIKPTNEVTETIEMLREELREMAERVERLEDKIESLLQ